MNFGEIEQKFNVVISDVGLGNFVVEADGMAMDMGLTVDVDGAKKELQKINCGNIRIR